MHKRWGGEKGFCYCCMILLRGRLLLYFQNLLCSAKNLPVLGELNLAYLASFNKVGRFFL